MSPETRMKSIWYLVSLVLLVMGALVFLAGILEALFPTVSHPTVLANLHPGIWWGAIMLIAGAIFFFKFRTHTHE